MDDRPPPTGPSARPDGQPPGYVPGSPPGYQPPPAFAPPALRVAPLNEYQVLGRSSYPAAEQPPQAAHWAAYYANAARYQPVPWHPALGASATTPAISRRLTVLVAAAVVAALIAVVALLSNSGPDPRVTRSLSVPESAGGYDRVSTLSGSQLQALGAGSAFGSFPSGDLAKARVGLFSRGSGAPTLVFVGFVADDSPTIGAELRSTEPITVVDEVFAGAGSGGGPPVDLDPGPLGGALEVADIDVGGQRATVAVWADADTLGIVMENSPVNRPDISEMAVLALAMRTAAEK